MSIYENIKEWITTQIASEEVFLSFENVLFVYGNSGIGKTYNILNLCRSLDLQSIYITTSNCSSSHELQDIIKKSISSSLIQVLANQKQKKIIIIDEFESLLSLDRTIANTLHNVILQGNLKKIPIICISSPEIIKNLGTIKKKCKFLQIDNPNKDFVLNVLSKLFPKKTNLSDIAIKSEGNIQKCIQFFENNIEFENTEITCNIFLSDPEKIRKCINMDQWLIPLKLHENIIKELINRKLKISDCYIFYQMFLENMILYDFLMYTLNTEYACELLTSILLILSMYSKKKKYISNDEKFTKMLSYMSLQKKYIKKIYSNDFPLYQIGNYHINFLGRNNIFFN